MRKIFARIGTMILFSAAAYLVAVLLSIVLKAIFTPSTIESTGYYVGVHLVMLAVYNALMLVREYRLGAEEFRDERFFELSARPFREHALTLAMASLIYVLPSLSAVTAVNMADLSGFSLFLIDVLYTPFMALAPFMNVCGGIAILVLADVVPLLAVYLLGARKYMLRKDAAETEKMKKRLEDIYKAK